MKKKLGKKGAFDTINAGMLTFISFVLIVLLSILVVATVQGTDLLRGGTHGGGSLGFDINNASTWSAGYNSTLELATAAYLPSEFAQIIVIVVIVAGILGMLAFVGFVTYGKFKG